MKFIFLMTPLLVVSLVGQTSVNPDISVIGTLAASHTDHTSTFNASDLEFAISGYVNPFARADIYIHKALDDHPFELEEAVLSIERGLPLGTALRLGKFRPDFGAINRQHKHLFPHIDMPEPVSHLLGDHQWSSGGLESSWLLPLNWYNKISVSLMEQGITPDAHTHDEEAEEHDDSGSALALRYVTFLELGTTMQLQLGLSQYQSVEHAGENLQVVDVKYKWRPDKYRSLTWQTEVFRKQAEEGSEDHEDHEPAVTAGYSLLDYQFSQKWNAGLILDYSSHIDAEGYRSAGAFMGFSPVEETTVLRLLLKQSRHGEEEAHTLIEAQITWSLGPHKVHQF